MDLKPFNIDLLVITDEIAKLVNPVTSTDIFEGVTKNLNKDGLYSQEIFGVRGSDVRYKKFSYIQLGAPVLHPLVYKTLLKMKGFYGDVFAGKAYAKVDKLTKDLVPCPPEEGETGYDFMFKVWPTLVFPENDSQQRQENIDFLTKYKGKHVLQRCYVLPAGYRDVEVDDQGRESSDDINSFYYKLIAISRTIAEPIFKTNPEVYNQQRLSLQNTLLDLFDYVLNILDGKNGLIMSKWAARHIADSTRNVITSMRAYTADLDGPESISINTAFMGVHQFMRSLLPVTCHRLMTGFLSTVFSTATAPALLTDKKTLKSTRTNVSPYVFDRWMTVEGLTKLIAKYGEPTIRNEPIMIGNYYLGLLYRGPDQTFKLIHGVDELPEGRLPEHCSPITYTELFYLTMYPTSEKYPFFTTRYPVASDRSIRPVLGCLVPTVMTEVRQELDGVWRPFEGPDYTAVRFPMIGSETFNSMAPHSSSLVMHEADFDGDTMSAVPVMTDESVAEVTDLFNDRSFYIGPDGDWRHDYMTDTIAFVFYNFTGPRTPKAA